MKKIWIIIVVVLLVIIGLWMGRSHHTETSSTAVASNHSVVVDMLNVVQNYNGTAPMLQAYQQQKVTLTAQLGISALANQVTQLQNQVNAAGSNATSEQVHALNAAKNQYQAAVSKLQESLNAYQTQQHNTFQSAVQVALTQVLKSNQQEGYSVVYNWESSSEVGSDITSQLVQVMNQNYQAN